MIIYNALFDLNGKLFFGLDATSKFIKGGQDEFVKLIEAAFHKVELK